VWLEYALACEYITKETYDILYEKYNNILGMLVNMSINPGKWTL